MRTTTLFSLDYFFQGRTSPPKQTKTDTETAPPSYRDRTFLNIQVFKKLSDLFCHTLAFIVVLYKTVIVFL